MAKALMSVGLLTTYLVCWSGAGLAATPAQILQYRPRQEGIVISTPTGAEIEACKVKWTPTSPGGIWLLLDPQGRPLRRLVDNKGDNKPHIWSYYHEGVEVYREIDSDFDGEPDQYRWLNSAGMKWGVELNKDHKIGSWRMISTEEVSQEILQAIISKDFSRIQAMFISDAEIDTLGIQAAEAAPLREQQKQAYAKFQNTIAKFANINEKTRWLHLETSPPQCIPADASGTKQDLIRYARGTILCETNGKHDWIQTGPMIKVGLAWRLTEAPGAGDGSADSVAASSIDPALQGLLDQLRDHDAKAPKAEAAVANPELGNYNLARANLLEQIIAKVKPEEREQWIRQLADCLASAAQYSSEPDKTAFPRLQRLEEQIVKAVPGSSLAAYITFREMSAENAIKMSKPGPDIAKVQERWLEKLTSFVSAYPKADDAPEALMQLGMVSEFAGKEIEAKKWYSRLAKDFPDQPMAVKAQGALRRLDIEGKPIELSGTLFDGTPFNIGQLQGKMVVVYYWASWNDARCKTDFATLKGLMDTYGSKGLALVCVNLDNTKEEAAAFLQSNPVPGIHLSEPRGLEGPLATQFGVMVLPNLFLVDKDGKVISRTIQQVSGLDEELKKRLN
jgi:peroxiredoxin